MANDDEPLLSLRYASTTLEMASHAMIKYARLEMGLTPYGSLDVEGSLMNVEGIVVRALTQLDISQDSQCERKAVHVVVSF